MKTNQIPAIIYLGDDNDFFKLIKKCLPQELIEKIHIIMLEPEVKISEIMKQYYVYCVFVDFSYYKTFPSHLVHEINYLKKIPELKPVLFSALIASDEDIEKNKIILNAGFSLIQLKGTEEWLFIQDTIAICFDIRALKLDFAKAKLDHITIPIYPLANIVQLGPRSMTIETDVSFEWYEPEEIELIHSLFSTNHIYSYPLLKQKEYGFYKNLFNTYEVEYPIAGPWDEEDEFTLFQDTIDAWFDSLKEDLISNKTILIFSEQYDLSLKFSSFNSEKIFVYHFIDLDLEKIEALLDSVCPQLIFFDFGDDNIGYGLLEKIIFFLKKWETLPAILVSNMTSKAEALKKLFKYPHILTDTKKLNLKIFEEFYKVLDQKKLNLTQESLVFKTEDPQQVVFLDLKGELTLYSEHKIIFQARFTLPLYSVVYLPLPIPSFATIVMVEEKNESLYYTAILHGNDFHKKEDIRRVVNQFIFKHPTHITHKNIQEILNYELDQPIHNDSQVALPQQEDSVETQNESNEENKKNEQLNDVIKRRTRGNKSKL